VSGRAVERGERRADRRAGADEDRRVALRPADASVSRSVSIRCMKSAGSSHSKAGMNSWSSIPTE
jgi:hypothetical protein